MGLPLTRGGEADGLGTMELELSGGEVFRLNMRFSYMDGCSEVL